MPRGLRYSEISLNNANRLRSRGASIGCGVWVGLAVRRQWLLTQGLGLTVMAKAGGAAGSAGEPSCQAQRVPVGGTVAGTIEL